MLPYYIFRLYELGYNPQIQNLFPTVEFPVSRGTPMISPKIIWNHSRKWWVTKYNHEDEMKTEENSFGISSTDPAYNFIKGHVIDGKF